MSAPPIDPEGHVEARQDLVLEIEADVRRTRRELGKGKLDARVIAALGKVVRRELLPVRFVPLTGDH